MEFASSLRLAGDVYPDDPLLQEMSEGELKTDNIVFESYHQIGDHWEFLDHFIQKLNIQPSLEAVSLAIRDYTDSVEEFPSLERAMTVFSREEELTLIFRRIVKAHDWDALGYGFYRYYLESHILFDSGNGGHHHLTKHFPLHPAVLERFYTIRLALYQALLG
ncbi:MAG: hypothetical protein AB199_00095 [Parcubacteria bacterium C7867-004]|nr:MAG: hypothetical protein AB199_00095 [Parcubacteria bacterium C7867-004]